MIKATVDAGRRGPLAGKVCITVNYLEISVGSSCGVEVGREWSNGIRLEAERKRLSLSVWFWSSIKVRRRFKCLADDRSSMRHVESNPD